MRVTETLINFELINSEAQKSCVFTSSGRKSFCDLSLLNVQTKEQIPFLTLELNQGILNGGLKHFSAEEQKNTAFISSSVSDENCKFSNVWVQGKLNTTYKFIGITLDFGIYYPKKITVEYYRGNIKILHTAIDEIDDTWIYVNMGGNDADLVKVIFEESWAPFSSANLQEFLFGNIIEWTADDIISGSLQEETDIISKVIPNDTLSLTIYSKTDDFNVLNPKGSYSYLLPNQRFKVKQLIYDLDSDTGDVKTLDEINLGYFYLDTWESLYNKQIKFNLVSPLAQLDKTHYKKSPMYRGTSQDSAYNALKAVFSDCGYNDYYIDESLKKVYLKGYIPVCTHKEALQQIAFVCSCLVYDNRGSPITVSPFALSNYQEINASNIFDPIKIEKKESITGLTINVHNFTLKSEREEVFKGFLPKGTREIIFNTPCENIQKTSENIVIKESGINYVVLKVLADGEYILTAQKYEDKSYKYIKEITDSRTVKKNTLDVDKAMLINPNNVINLAENLMSFYRMYNLTIEFKFISDGQLTGQNAVFTDNQNRTFAGAFIRQNLDIGNGFLSNCYIIGYQQINEGRSDYLCSKSDNPPNETAELYSDEEYGMI